MTLSESQRCARLVLVAAGLAACALGCSDDNRGPTIGAPTGPVVIVDGGGSGPTGGSGASGTGANGGATAIGGSDVNVGAGLAGNGGADFLGAGGTDVIGTAGALGVFGIAGTPLPFSGGGPSF
jgi:hypothetical protein